jgi:MFS transporter, DHA1 family, tetracycline resistance protein
MVIPLIGLYGRHFGLSGWHLALLGAIYSLTQFWFAPIWGSLSDRFGRRPVLLFSLAGSTASYFLFGLAESGLFLFLSRLLGGVFAANISAAQAAIADITPPEKRSAGMGIIGAAFGLGFTLGPPLGGYAAHYFGLHGPGIAAGCLCLLNFLVAIFRLKETHPPEKRSTVLKIPYFPLGKKQIQIFNRIPARRTLLSMNFISILAFAMTEQVFSLLFQTKFLYSTEEAGLKTGLILMGCGLLGALIQGKWIRTWIPKFGEANLIFWGFLFNLTAMFLFPFGPNYASYYLIVIPLAIGSSLLTPSLSGLISRSTSHEKQGETLGLNQGLGSLARAGGSFLGLSLFQTGLVLPFFISGLLALWMANTARKERSTFSKI